MSIGYRARLGLLAALSACAFAASAAQAEIKLSYHITGSYNAGEPAGGSSELNFGSFGIQTAGGGTSGGLQVTPQGAFSIDRPEFFSDTVFPTPIVEADLRTFSYFGLVKVSDENGVPVSSRFFAAVEPGTATGVALGTLLSDFFTNNPTITTAAFLQAVEDGADFPEPGPNETFLTIRSYFEFSGPTIYRGDIGTSFQTAETFDLVAFDGPNLTGSVIGNIQVNAQAVPEPAALGLLLPTVSLLARRRRA